MRISNTLLMSTSTLESIDRQTCPTPKKQPAAPRQQHQHKLSQRREISNLNHSTREMTQSAQVKRGTTGLKKSSANSDISRLRNPSTRKMHSSFMAGRKSLVWRKAYRTQRMAVMTMRSWGKSWTTTSNPRRINTTQDMYSSKWDQHMAKQRTRTLHV